MKKRLIFIFSLLSLLIVICASCNKEMYTVTFDTNGGTMYTDTMDVEYNGYYALPTPRQAGYDFLGWYNGDKKVDMIGYWEYRENVHLVAKWEFAKYHITYNLNGGTAANPTEYTSTTESFVISPPTKEDGIFYCWLDENNKEYYGDIIIPKGSEGNRKFTAIWWNLVDENGVSYSYKDGALTVIGYNGNMNVGFTIPQECYGKKVVAIGEGAFEGLGNKINSGNTTFRINIPSTITEIHKNAFHDCFDIKVLLIPSENDTVISTSYAEMVEKWADEVVVYEGNDHLIDVIKQKRPAIGWSEYFFPEN